MTEATRSRLLRLEKEKHPFRPQLYKLPKHVVPRRRGDGSRAGENAGKEGGKEAGGRGENDVEKVQQDVDDDDFSLLHDMPGEAEKAISSSGGGGSGEGRDRLPGQPKKEAHANPTSTSTYQPNHHSHNNSQSNINHTATTATTTNPPNPPTLKPKAGGGGGGGGSGSLLATGSSSSSSSSSPKKHWNGTCRIKHADDNVPASLYTPSTSITQTLRQAKPAAVVPPHPPVTSRINKPSYVSSLIHHHHQSQHHNPSSSSSSSLLHPPSNTTSSSHGTNPTTNHVVYSTNLSLMNSYGLHLRALKTGSGGGQSGFEGIEHLSNLPNHNHNHQLNNDSDHSNSGTAADETASLPLSVASSKGGLIIILSTHLMTPPTHTPYTLSHNI